MPHPASSYAWGIKKCNTFVALDIGIRASGESGTGSAGKRLVENEGGCNGHVGTGALARPGRAKLDSRDFLAQT